MPRVVHFEIHADEPERAANFYRNVFGWQINKWEGPEDYWLITTGPDSEPGINGAIMRRNHVVTGDSVITYVCTVDVPAVDDYIEKAMSNGGTVAVPKMAVPQVGWLAYYKDTEGNIFGMMQSDSSAV